MSSRSSSPKIRPEHLDRHALIYVRQSTAMQVRENIASTARQYDLARYADHLGWPKQHIKVIDQDQGHSGASSLGRDGFQHLMAEVCLGHAGAVLSLEASRLARSCSDWYRLIEVCSLTDTLVIDEDGVYDPTQYNDRLLLGIKVALCRRHEFRLSRLLLALPLLPRPRPQPRCGGDVANGPIVILQALRPSELSSAFNFAVDRGIGLVRQWSPGRGSTAACGVFGAHTPTCGRSRSSYACEPPCAIPHRCGSCRLQSHHRDERGLIKNRTSAFSIFQLHVGVSACQTRSRSEARSRI